MKTVRRPGTCDTYLPSHTKLPNMVRHTLKILQEIFRFFDKNIVFYLGTFMKISLGERELIIIAFAECTSRILF